MLVEGKKKRKKKKEVISITLVYIKEELRHRKIKRQHIPYIKFRFQSKKEAKYKYYVDIV